MSACGASLGQGGKEPPATTLPWPVYEYDRVRQFIGEDFRPYGAHENRHAIEMLARYSFQQGLSAQPVPLAEMFAKPTLSCRKYIVGASA
ncbi:MAG: hypothetical protein WEA28_09655 [Xanthobacteraceae bacterium]